MSIPQKTQQQEINAIEGFTREDLNAGKVLGIAAIMDDGDDIDLKKSRTENSRGITTVVLSDDIKAFSFLRILEFLYTGEISGKKWKMDIIY